MSVRARFAAIVATAIAITVALFATVSIFAIDRALRSGFEARLLTTAQAVSTTVDYHHGRAAVDAGDLRELANLHADTPFAVYDIAGVQVAGDALPPQPQALGIQTASVPVMRGNLKIGTVTVWQSNVWIGDFDRIAAIVSAVVGLVLVVLGVLVSRRAAAAALAPLERLASLAERIEGGRDLALRLDADGDDELGRLCASFDRMLDRLDAAFARERRILADASHELRAPLAVLVAETELALRRQRSDEEYRAALASVAREAARLEELVDELLAAARIEVDARERQAVDAGDLVRDVGERVRPAAAVRGIEVRIENGDGAVARANAASVERALLAIVHNAVAFARENVRLAVACSGDDVRIDVADDGPGFTPEALEHATERFRRGDSARPRGGTGLGLTIARTMIEANGGRLSLANNADGGALVSVTLVAAAGGAA